MKKLTYRNVGAIFSLLTLCFFAQGSGLADTIRIINLCNQGPMSFTARDAKLIQGCTTKQQTPPIKEQEEGIVTVNTVGEKNLRCEYIIDAGDIAGNNSVYAGSGVTCSPTNLGLACLCRDNGGAIPGPIGK